MVNLRHTFSQDLSLAPLNITKEFVYDVELRQLTLHFSVPVTENIRITIDSLDGSNYDTLVEAETLIKEQDYLLSRVLKPVLIQVGDKINIQCTNANGVGTVYGTLIMGVDYYGR